VGVLDLGIGHGGFGLADLLDDVVMDFGVPITVSGKINFVFGILDCFLSCLSGEFSFSFDLSFIFFVLLQDRVWFDIEINTVVFSEFAAALLVCNRVEPALFWLE
jgi:hypothetical protein